MVVNQTDNSDVYRLYLDISQATGEIVDPKNVAAAIASCEACKTVVVAIQAVLVTGDPQVFAPENYAVAKNVACLSCETFAFASQLILQTDGPFQLTPEGERRIAELRRELEALSQQDLSLDELLARVQQLNKELAQVLITEVEAAAPSAGAAPTGSGDQQTAGTTGGGSAAAPGSSDTPFSTPPTDTSEAPAESPIDTGTTTSPTDTGTTTETTPTETTPTDTTPTETAPDGTGTSTTTAPTTQDTSTTPTP